MPLHGATIRSAFLWLQNVFREIPKVPSNLSLGGGGGPNRAALAQFRGVLEDAMVGLALRTEATSQQPPGRSIL